MDRENVSNSNVQVIGLTSHGNGYTEYLFLVPLPGLLVMETRSSECFDLREAVMTRLRWQAPIRGAD